MKKIDLKGLSTRELERLSKRAAKLANDLEKQEPSDALCIANGIRDKSYNTVANGMYFSYSGECTITMEDGSVWRCVGVSSGGDAYYGTNGYIEKTKISD